jgi:hypothetical protein
MPEENTGAIRINRLPLIWYWISNAQATLIGLARCRVRHCGHKVHAHAMERKWMESADNQTPQPPRKTYPKMENAAIHIQKFRNAVLTRLFNFFFEYIPRLMRRCATWIQNTFTPWLGAWRRVLLQVFGTIIVFLVPVILWGFVCWILGLLVWPEWWSKSFIIPSVLWGIAIIIAVLLEVSTIIKTQWGRIGGFVTLLIFLAAVVIGFFIWWYGWFKL